MHKNKWKDISVVKALIKRAITDQELLLPRIDTKKIFYKDGRELSRTAIFRNLKRFNLMQLDGQILKTYTKLSKHQKREEIAHVYIDLEHAVRNRKVGIEKYPSEFIVAARYLDSKGNWLEIEDDYKIFKVSIHCIERLLQRSKADSFADAIRLLSPIADHLIKLCDLLLHDRYKYYFTSNEYLIYWADGYLVLRHDINKPPILITWLPKDSFTVDQFSKFINFEGRVNASPQIPIVFESEKARDKKVLSIGDELFELSSGWEFDFDDILWSRIKSID